jgi:SAM-dependent methyltransferase
MNKEKFIQHLKNHAEKESQIDSMRDIPELGEFRLAVGLVNPNSKVLSCGCGGGREVKFLVNTLNCKVTAIENSRKVLNRSRQIEPKAKYILADISKFETDEEFDYVLCLQRTINHLPDLETRRKFIENSFNHLKIGGRLIISTSHKFSSLRKFYRSLIGLWGYYPYPSEINKWFEGFDFDIYFDLYKIKVGDSLIILAKKR